MVHFLWLRYFQKILLHQRVVCLISFYWVLYRLMIHSKIRHREVVEYLMSNSECSPHTHSHKLSLSLPPLSPSFSLTRTHIHTHVHTHARTHARTHTHKHTQNTHTTHARKLSPNYLLIYNFGEKRESRLRNAFCSCAAFHSVDLVHVVVFVKSQ